MRRWICVKAWIMVSVRRWPELGWRCRKRRSSPPRGSAPAVTRFDRRWAQEGRVLLRLPQEDLCQAFGLPSAMKYESDGGPGIAAIMTFLLGSSEALKDRYDFMKFMVFQWLTGRRTVTQKLLNLPVARQLPLNTVLRHYFGVSGAGRHGTASARSEAVDGAQCYKRA